MCKQTEADMRNVVEFYLQKIAAVLDGMPIEDVRQLVDEMDAINPLPVKP
jgi:hypothetical protein